MRGELRRARHCTGVGRRLSGVALALLLSIGAPAAGSDAAGPEPAVAPAEGVSAAEESTVAWLLRLLTAAIAQLMGWDGDAPQTGGQAGRDHGDVSGPGGLEGAIALFVEEQRRKLPLRMGDDAELVDIRLSARTISFYVALHYDAGEVNRQTLKPMQAAIRSRACADRAFRLLGRLNARATYVLTDSRNRTLYRFFLDPKQCG